MAILYTEREKRIIKQGKKFTKLVDHIAEILVVYVIVPIKSYKGNIERAEEDVLKECQWRYDKELKVVERKISINKENYVFTMIQKCW